MARDNRGRIPDATADLRRVSLKAPHWRQARWLLAVEAVATGIAGSGGLIGLAVSSPDGAGPVVVGIQITAGLSFALLVVAAAAAVAVTHRRVATVVTASMSIVAIILVTLCAVAATHSDPGPFGSTAPVMLLWAVVFCYNFAVGVWLVPDHIEGPAWLPRRRTPRSTDRSGSGLPR